MSASINLSYEGLVDTALANENLFKFLVKRQEKNDTPEEFKEMLKSECNIRIALSDAARVLEALELQEELAKSMGDLTVQKEYPFMAQVRWRN
jgi:hypothetical protein